MTENEDNIVSWLESQFSELRETEFFPEWPFTRILAVLSMKLFNRPRDAVKSILSGQSKKRLPFLCFGIPIT